MKCATSALGMRIRREGSILDGVGPILESRSLRSCWPLGPPPLSALRYEVRALSICGPPLPDAGRWSHLALLLGMLGPGAPTLLRELETLKGLGRQEAWRARWTACAGRWSAGLPHPGRLWTGCVQQPDAEGTEKAGAEVGHRLLRTEAAQIRDLSKAIPLEVSSSMDTSPDAH